MRTYRPLFISKTLKDLKYKVKIIFFFCSKLKNFYSCYCTQDLHDFEKQFVSELFYGCADKSSTVNVPVDGYYAKDGKTCLKSEKNYYKSKKNLIPLIQQII